MTHILDGLNESQLKIAKTLDEPVFVAAGAGSGKTFTLTRRIVWALTPGSGKDGASFLDSLDEALVITFTEKAAAEIRERIRSALHDAGMHQQALSADSAWISTIHGMCSRILHAEALELGLNPDFEMIADHDARDLRNRAANEVLAAIRDSGEYDELMYAYAASGVRNASSDDTTSVLGMVKSLVEQAAQRPGGFDDIVFSPHNANAYEVANELLLRYEELASIPTQKGKEHQESAMKDVAASRDVLFEFLNRPPSQITFGNLAVVLGRVVRPDGNKLGFKEVKESRKAATQALAWAKNVVACEACAPYESELLEIAKRIDARFTELKREKGVLDNDDLLVLTYRAFKERPEIAARYKGFFKLVMIDEFQDTNAQQIEMIKLVAGDAPICTVGDAQQSIYRFRGADVEVFRKTEHTMNDVVRMDTNFRSHDDVLRFVARVCDKTEGVDGCFVPDFMDLKAGSDGTGSCPDIPRVYYELAVRSKNGRKMSGLQVDLQARLLASRLKRIKDAGVEPGQMAVLMRSMGKLDVYQKALREYGLESVIAGGSTYAGAPEVGVVAALLDVLANPKDTKNGLYPVLASELFRLQGDDFIALATRMQETVEASTKRRIDAGLLSGVYLESITPSDRLDRAHDILARAWVDSRRKDMAEVVEMVCRDSGWFSRMQSYGVEGQAQAANVLRAIEHIREFCDKQNKGPVAVAKEFRAWLEASSTGPASLVGGSSNAVQIMTIHASKGLEFPVVAVVETFKDPRSSSGDGIVYFERDDKLVACLKPPKESLYAGSSDDLPEKETDLSRCSNAYEWRCCAEENELVAEQGELGRLVYVGLTRAKDALVVVSTMELAKAGSAPASAKLLDDLAGARLEPGVSTFEYGGSAPGVKEVVVIDPDQTIDEAIAACESIDPELHIPAPEAAFDSGSVSFDVYDVEKPATSFRPWSVREGVFSYSSAHKDVEPIVFDRDESESRDVEYDPDRATSLGSAFHALAQFIAERQSYPEPERIDAVSRQFGVRPKDKGRLKAALVRWYDSDLRQDTLLAHSIHSEMPFFVEVDSSQGTWLEGAFDLLCDMGGGIYHVIDYKTGDLGLNESQMRQLHEMQSDYYARVLLDQGAKHVTCTFVMVERDVDGQPMSVTYEYDGSIKPSLDGR